MLAAAIGMNSYLVFAFLFPIISAPLIWLGVAHALIVLIWALSLVGLVDMPEGTEFEARLHLTSAGATLLIVLMLYSELLGLSDFIEWL